MSVIKEYVSYDSEMSDLTSQYLSMTKYHRRFIRNLKNSTKYRDIYIYIERERQRDWEGDRKR